ncbi:alpha/beta hydrolase [Sulfurimonas lithotrophica]|uniref:Alpha/beta hydrolase n=1 Tax=Sulfurimonas lithotrophica TaxID=2590022 RepID=A0A5P8P3D4_9BACT|nr:alpha/beta hydrolase [Sulfurimonas lithotrophica]QFR50209.1 alpha/beta hydrolase [Sulfurimonas lithotrophica]
MKTIIHSIILVFISLLFVACGPKTFPSDNKIYDSPKNYEYSYTSHTFLSEDSTKLYAYHIKSDEQNSKGLIVLANGMKQNMSFRFTEWLWILDAGYDLFIFDYRSYGESYAEADLFGFVDDVKAALKYAHSLDKEKKIVLIGQSMGGTFVINALKNKEYDYLSFAVSDSTFTGFDDVLSSLLRRSIILFPFSWIPYLTVPKELNADENIQYLKTPILFIAGDDDIVVDYEDSIELYNMTKAKKALWIVKDAAHVQSFNNLEVRDNFLKILEDNTLLFKQQKKIFK